MPIELDQPTPEIDYPPTAKTAAVGDGVTIHIVDVREIECKDFATKETETWPNGDPKLQMAITGTVSTVEGGSVGRKDGDDVPLTPGDLCTIFTGSFGRKDWRQAVTDYGVVNVGDLLEWRLDHEEAAKTAGYNPRKIRTYRLAHPKPGDVQAVQAAEAHYMERRETIEAAADAGAGNEDPF